MPASRCFIGFICAAMLPLAALAADPAPAAGAAFDPAAAWRQFLAGADSSVVGQSYSVIASLRNEDGSYDAEKCRANAVALDKAIAAVPVSLALRFHAYRCAEARKDDAAADRYLSDFGVLARHALAQASDDPYAPPIRVVTDFDIYALIDASGLELRYEFLTLSPQPRYLTLVTASWDPKAKLERRLRFDFLDTLVRIERKNPISPYPLFRQQLRETFIKQMAEHNRLAALDLQAVRRAYAADAAADKIAAVRPMAEQGGIQSSLLWLAVCDESPFAGCGAGLVDALLPKAEKRFAMPMVILALANARGIGVKKDEAAAMALLDAAETVWGKGRALYFYADEWTSLDTKGFPPALQSRLDRAASEGNPDIPLAALTRRIDSHDGYRATPDELKQLEAMAENGRIATLALIATQRYYSDERTRALPWVRRAAEAGDPTMQETYGSALLYGNALGLDVDRTQGLHWLGEAAAGINDDAMIILGRDAARRSDWTAAELWYVSAANFGGSEGALALAGLYGEGHPGLHGDGKRGAEIYSEMSAANDENSAAARRSWALMLAAGKAVPKDAAAAEKLLRQDADKGDVMSAILLANSLLDGSLGRVDEVEGVRVFEAASKDADSGADAADALAYWLYYKKATPEAKSKALSVWQRLVARDDVPLAMNNLAWVRCTATEPSIRQPAEGLALVGKMSRPEFRDSSELDTVAACQAANADFANAIVTQLQAIARLQAFDDKDDSLPGMRERLAEYRSGKAHFETKAP